MHEGQHLTYPLPDFRFWRTCDLESVAGIVEHRHVREDRVGLEDHVDRTLVRCHPAHLLSVNQQVSGGWNLETREHPQQRGLSASGRAEQREKLALTDFQRNVVHRCDLRSKAFHDVADLDD